MVLHIKDSGAAQYNQLKHLQALLFSNFSQGFNCAGRAQVLLCPSRVQ